MTLTAKVLKYQSKFPHLNCREVQAHFCEKSPGYIKKLYYKNKKGTNKVVTVTNPVTPGDKINMDMTEALLMAKLKANPDVATLRLIMDFLKIKQQDHSELEEIDLTKFYKKAMEE